MIRFFLALSLMLTGAISRACLVFLSVIFVCLSTVLLPISAMAGNEHKIRVLVGNSPITDFQIEQRVNLNLMSSQELSKRLKAKFKAKSTQDRWKAYIQKARPTSKAEVQALQKKFVARLQSEARSGIASSMKKKVLEELINERLQINAAKAMNIVIGDNVVNQRVAMIAKRNSKGTEKEATAQFYKMLAGRGVGRSTFKERIRATLAWQQVIRRKFGADVNFGDRDVELQLGLDDQSLQDRKIQLKLVQIDLVLANHKDQAAVVKQYVEADAIRKRFNGCSNMKSLIAPYKNATFTQLGKKTLDQMPSPINLILGDMKAGQMTPPQPTEKGIQMFAVCDRQQVAIDDNQRSKTLSELRQKAYQLRADKYMNDVRQDAHIEYRD